MKKLLKKKIKKVVNRLGYTILKNENYNQLIQTKKDVNVNSHSKNSLLKSFFTVLKNQYYYPDTIYDIGANKGTWTKECLKYFPNATYYLFEPQIDLKDDIEEVIKNHENAHLFTVGVGDVNDKLNFTIHERDDSCSYSFTKEEATNRSLKQILLPIVKLETFVKENNLKPPALLKIDAEGLDLKVLEGAKSLLQNVEIIMVEVGVMNNRIENTALQTLNYLDSKGFRLFDFTDINRPFSNQVLWLCEFVFIKKDGILDKNYSKY